MDEVADVHYMVSLILKDRELMLTAIELQVLECFFVFKQS